MTGDAARSLRSWIYSNVWTRIRGILPDEWVYYCIITAPEQRITYLKPRYRRKNTNE